VKPLPRIFVVNDDPAVSSAIEALLTAQTYEVKCFASAEDFIAQHSPNHVGCVVINLSAPGTGGAELIRHLHETRSLLSVVIISGLIDAALPHLHEKQVVPILAKAYEVWVFLTMIEDAMAGSLKRDRILVDGPNSQADTLHDYGLNLTANEKILNLSPRQRQVLSCLLAGNSLKEVAQKLELSAHTVGDYVKQIYKHFAVSSRAELAALFIPGDL
jgi:two-component system response regulator TtrR